MIRLLAALLFAVAAMATPDTALAEQPHGGPAPGQAVHADDHAVHEKGELLPPANQGLPAMIAAYLVFGLVFFVLARKAWPPIVKGLQDREEKIRSEIEAAEMARQQARDALEQYQRSLADARAEGKRILDETKAQQQQLAASLRAQSEAELLQMKDRARREIEGAKRAALDEIHRHAVVQATNIAARILQRELSQVDQQRMIDESLRELQTQA